MTVSVGLNGSTVIVSVDKIQSFRFRNGVERRIAKIFFGMLARHSFDCLGESIEQRMKIAIGGHPAVSRRAMLCMDTKLGLITPSASARFSPREAVRSSAKPPINLLANNDPISIPAEMMGYPIMIPAKSVGYLRDIPGQVWDQDGIGFSKSFKSWDLGEKGIFAKRTTRALVN